MKPQLSWKVGGQQGEGIESTGEIFATAMNRKGYYLYGYRHFSSRIKGGHTNNKIRVSTTPVHAISDDLDILIAFDQETIDVNHHEMREDSIILAVAIGATSALMNLNTNTFEELITNMFSKKGDKVVEVNIQALNEGYQLMQSRLPEIDGDFELESTDALPHLYMIGNDAIGLGAIAAGSQFMAAYPITPASEVMEYMIANISKVNG